MESHNSRVLLLANHSTSLEPAELDASLELIADCEFEPPSRSDLVLRNRLAKLMAGPDSEFIATSIAPSRTSYDVVSLAANTLKAQARLGATVIFRPDVNYVGQGLPSEAVSWFEKLSSENTLERLLSLSSILDFGLELTFLVARRGYVSEIMSSATRFRHAEELIAILIIQGPIRGFIDSKRHGASFADRGIDLLSLKNGSKGISRSLKLSISACRFVLGSFNFSPLSFGKLKFVLGFSTLLLPNVFREVTRYFGYSYLAPSLAALRLKIRKVNLNRD